MAATLILREPFSAQATYTSGSPGNLGVVGNSFTRRAVGPRLTSDTTASSMGWSGDLNNSPNNSHTWSGTQAAAAFPASGSSFAMQDWWIYVDHYLPNNGTPTPIFNSISTGSSRTMIALTLSSDGLGTLAGTTGMDFTGNPVITYTVSPGTWYNFRVAWNNGGSTNYTVSVLVRQAGAGAFTELASIFGALYSPLTSTTAAGGPGTLSSLSARYGLPGLYTLAAFADRFNLLTDQVDPPSGPFTWYCNPATGNDLNDGLSSGSAFASVTELNARSAACGFFSHAAPAPFTPTSVTMSGGVATVTATAHGLANGRTFAIAGARPVWLNTVGTVSNATANTFTFTPLYVPSPYSGASLTASGTIRIGAFALGDTVVIDTSGALLDIGTNAILAKTRGLILRPANGQPFAQLKAWKDVSGATAGGSTVWTQYNAGTYPRIWMTTDGGATDLFATVIWENDAFMSQPQGANIAAVAAAMNTNASGAGQFYSPGTTSYLVTSDNSNPNTNGKTYTRSRQRPGQTGGQSAVYLTAADMQTFGINVTKTCVADPTNGDPGNAYGIQADGSYGGTSRISGCYADRCSKHTIGLSQSSNNEIATVDGCQIEQGTPYGSAGQSLTVSYNAFAVSGACHNYVNILSNFNTGLIGSAGGAPLSTSNSGVFYSHGNGTGSNQYAEVNWINPSVQGTITGGSVVIINLNVFGGTCGGFSGSHSGVALVDRVTTTWTAVLNQGPGSTIATNSIMKFTAPLYAGVLSGVCGVFGDLEYYGCTISALGATIGDTTNAGVLQRASTLTFTMKDCIFLANDGTSSNVSLLRSAINTDTITLSHNAYQVGASGVILASYNDGSTTANRTAANLVTLGKDSGSVSATSGIVNASYGLPGGSIARGLGASDAALAGLPDLEGHVRPSNGALDSGAMQFVALASCGAALSIATGLALDES